jgi:hypothetical protein
MARVPIYSVMARVQSQSTCCEFRFVLVGMLSESRCLLANDQLFVICQK